MIPVWITPETIIFEDFILNEMNSLEWIFNRKKNSSGKKCISVLLKMYQSLDTQPSVVAFR